MESNNISFNTNGTSKSVARLETVQGFRQKEALRRGSTERKTVQAAKSPFQNHEDTQEIPDSNRLTEDFPPIPDMSRRMYQGKLGG